MCGVDHCHGFVCTDHRLSDQQIHACIHQSGDLFLIGRKKLIVFCIHFAGRGDISGDQSLSLYGFF